MRILILLKKFPGGVGRSVLDISNILKKLGHKVEIISGENDLKCFSLMSSIFKIREIVRKKNFDIVYTQDWSLALPLLFPSRIFKKKHFCCFHGQENSKISGFFQSVVGNVMGGKLIVVGDSLKKKFPKSNLIYEGVNIKEFKPLKIKKIKNSVGFANWTTKEYNYGEIMKAVKFLGKEFLVAKNVIPNKMNKFYNKLETFISLPPYYAGFGLVWLEAMAAGVPKIIGSNVSIGKKLPITKIEKFGWNKARTKKEKIWVLINAIKNAKKNNYRKWLIDHKFMCEITVKKIVDVFEKGHKKKK